MKTKHYAEGRGTAFLRIPHKKKKKELNFFGWVMLQLSLINTLKSTIRVLFCLGFTLFVYTKGVAQRKAVLDVKYKRSSLYSLILSDDDRKYENIIKETFLGSPIPNKFNDHNLDLRVIKKQKEKEDSTKVKLVGKVKGMFQKIGKKRKESEVAYIDSILMAEQVAKNLVAKWFQRTAKGGFSMDLVAERGFYNASEIDINLAKNSQKGKALLADAGEQLIANTFVVVNDFKFISKADAIQGAKKGWKLLKNVKQGNVAALATKDTDTSSVVGTVLGKGYIIKVKSYLFRLKWDEDIAANFYYDFWTTDKKLNNTKKKNFEESDLFQMDYIGKKVDYAEVQSTIFGKKTETELIEIATRRATDKVIIALQKEYDVFKTKSPLTDLDPLKADIGLKEGLSPKTKFEILEQILNEDGTTNYKRIGQIVPIGDHIWDNQYLAEELEPDQEPYTTFKMVKGNKNKLYPGLLIRQIK